MIRNDLPKHVEIILEEEIDVEDRQALFDRLMIRLIPFDHSFESTFYLENGKRVPLPLKAYALLHSHPDGQAHPKLAVTHLLPTKEVHMIYGDTTTYIYNLAKTPGTVVARSTYMHEDDRAQREILYGLCGILGRPNPTSFSAHVLDPIGRQPATKISLADLYQQVK